MLLHGASKNYGNVTLACAIKQTASNKRPKMHLMKSWMKMNCAAAVNTASAADYHWPGSHSYRHCMQTATNISHSTGHLDYL